MALGTRELLLVIRARDEASRVLGKLASNMGDVDKGAQEAMKDATARGGALVTMGATLTGFGAVGLKFFSDTMDAATQYDTAAALAKTQTDDLSVSVKGLEDMGRRVARSIPVSLDETQKALYTIFSTVDVNSVQSEKLLRAFSKAAVAGQTDINTATEGTLRVMNAFKLGVNGVTRANDVMFQLVRKGVGTYEDFNKAIGKAAPSAVRAGQSVESLAGMMAFLTRNGLSASMAATSAARALDAVANPKFQTNMKAMGMSVVDAQGNFKPMIQIAQEISDKLANMTAPEKSAAIAKLFAGAGNNVQALRFYNLVVNNDQAFNQLTGDMNKASGAMGRAYDIMFKSPQSQVQLLTNQYDAMKTEIGEKLLPIKLKLMHVLESLLGWWTKLTPATQKNIVIIVAVVAALAVLVGIILAVAGAVTMLNGAIAVLDAELLPIIGPILLVIGILIALGVAVFLVIKYHKQIWEWMKKIWGDIWNFLKGLWQDIVNIAKTVWNSIVDFFKGIWQKVSGFFVDAWNQIVSEAKALPGKILDFFSSLPNKIAHALGELVGTLARWGYDAFQAAVKALVGIIIWFRDLPDNIAKFLANVRQWLETKGVLIILGILQGIEHAYENVVAWFKALPGNIAKFFANAYHWLMDSGKSTGKGLLDGLISAYESIIGWFKSLPGNMLKWVAGAYQWLRDTGKDIIHGLWEGIKNAWNNFIDWIKGLWDSFIKGVKDAFGAHSPSSVMLQVGIDILKGLWNGIVNTATTVWDWISSLPGKLGSLVSNAGKWLWNTGKDLIMGLLYGIHDWEVKIWDWLKNVPSNIWNNVKNAGQWLWDTGKNLIMGLLLGIHDWEVKIWNWLKAVPGNIWNNVKNAGQWLWNTGKDLAMGLLFGIHDWEVNIWNWFKSLPGTIWGWIKNAGSWLVDMGSNLLRGLWNGMENVSSWIFGKVKDFFLNLLPGWVKKMLGISSPSKVFSEFGKMTMLGFAGGMQSAVPAAIRTAIAAASSVTDAFNTTVSGPGFSPFAAGVVGQPAAAGTTGGGAAGPVVPITIYTQEINPLQHAAELGQAIANRVG